MGFWDAFADGARQVFGTAGPLVVLGLAAAAILVVALRRRRDVDVKEMTARIVALEARVETLEDEREENRAELASTRESLVQRDRDVFILRSTLARRGIPDPTLEAS